MSLYAFGKVIGVDVSTAVLSRATPACPTWHIEVDAVDSDDAACLERSRWLAGRGSVFALWSDAKSTDATRLWIEASSHLAADPSSDPATKVRRLLETRLGHACQAILQSGESAGIALVDGGIDLIHEGDLASCLLRVAEDVSKPWDQAPNRLYVRAPHGQPS